MPRLAEIIEFLEEFAPLSLAEEWDNVGLLVGHLHGEADVTRVLTCLTLTPEVAAEAISESCQLVVTHHPVLFRPVQKLTDATPEGAMICDLIAAGVAVYSPHTAFDSTTDGINQSLAESLDLTEIMPLRTTHVCETTPRETPLDSDDRGDSLTVGSGRWGTLPNSESLADFNRRVKAALGVDHLQYVGEETHEVRRVGIACGAAAEFLTDARRVGCDVFLTGEARFHACLEAWNTGIAMVLPGHYATERPAVEQLAVRIGDRFSDLDCQPSRQEADPVRWSVS